LLGDFREVALRLQSECRGDCRDLERRLPGDKIGPLQECLHRKRLGSLLPLILDCLYIVSSDHLFVRWLPFFLSFLKISFPRPFSVLALHCSPYLLHHISFSHGPFTLFIFSSLLLKPVSFTPFDPFISSVSSLWLLFCFHLLSFIPSFARSFTHSLLSFRNFVDFPLFHSSIRPFIHSYTNPPIYASNHSPRHESDRSQGNGEGED
jgi:hypothetical protein